MNRNVVIAVAVGIAVIIGAISFQLYDSAYQKSSIDEYYADKDHSDEKNIKHVVYPDNPQKLYGLIINKDKYLLGENIFIRVTGIPMGLKDSVYFYTPQGIKYLTLPFDGDEKPSIKHYFRPSLIRSENVCDKEEIIGKWSAFFGNMPEEKLYFHVLAEILPHSEDYYLGCNEDPMEIPPYVQPSLGE